MSEIIEFPGQFGEDNEWLISVEDESTDEICPTVNASIVIGSRWGDHSWLNFVPLFAGSAANANPIQDVETALQNMTVFRDDISRAMDRLREIKRRLEKEGYTKLAPVDRMPAILNKIHVKGNDNE